MKLFIWERIGHCTDRWHPEGGMVAVASTPERAIEMAKALGCLIQESEHFDVMFDLPDDTKEYICLFPDAGCC